MSFESRNVLQLKPGDVVDVAGEDYVTYCRYKASGCDDPNIHESEALLAECEYAVVDAVDVYPDGVAVYFEVHEGLLYSRDAQVRVKVK